MHVLKPSMSGDDVKMKGAMYGASAVILACKDQRAGSMHLASNVPANVRPITTTKQSPQ